jgi:hypothetical protein
MVALIVAFVATFVAGVTVLAVCDYAFGKVIDWFNK